MRRLIILFYWMFKSRNNVSLSELFSFLMKAKVQKIAETYIERVEEESEHFKISFVSIKPKLFWPKEFSLAGLYQVTTETFDPKDWHYYQKNFTKVNPSDVVLDVGAAEGLFALSIVEKCKEVVLIEPNDIFHRALLRTFEHYKDRVTIHGVAVGNTEGEIVFSNDSLSGSVADVSTAGTKKRITRIDSLIPATQRINYFKADIEGYELEMLKGSAETIKRNKPKLVVTTYHTENNAAEIISFVTSLVPEYKFFVKGVFHQHGKPVMVHFYM